jgi:glutamyl-tRNA synthetase
MTAPTPVHTRFAPSPTGRTHLGNLRTALFAWLAARHSGGRFMLRIEDTDRRRLDPNAQAELMAAMRWLGLEWDEGPDVGGPHAPYVQSDNRPAYEAAAQQLVAAGHAYYCDCSSDRLEIVRKMQQQRGIKATRYDNHCRNRNLGHGPDRVIRFKVPETGHTTFTDQLRGEITVENKDFGDTVILKSDGYPTYHLAVIIDDHRMGVSHVLRAEEWLPSTPIHTQLYAAFGWQAPLWLHLPLVTDFEGRKIKKRTTNADLSDEYIEYAEMLRVSTLQAKGYIAEAVFNFLAFLGWHPGSTEEIMTRAQIIERFSLDRLSASPGVFDVDRMNWFNQQHLKKLSLDEVAAAVLPYLRAAHTDSRLDNPAWVSALVLAVREELITFAEMPDHTGFAFADPTAYAEEARAEMISENGRQVLNALRSALPAADSISAEAANQIFKTLREQFKQSHKLNGKQVMQPLRLALTGQLSGAHLNDIVAIIGADATRRRLDTALSLA